MTDKTELLRQEVRELTEMLRSGDGFSALRSELNARRVPLAETVLAGFIESEDEEEYGAIITRDLKCIAWEADGEGSITRWDVIDDPGSLSDAFEAISIGISMGN